MTEKECLVKRSLLKSILSVSNKITGVGIFIKQLICINVKVKNSTYIIRQNHYRIVALSH